MHDAWYYTDATSQPHGPMTAADLVRLHQAGRIHAGTLVRHADWTGWQALADAAATLGIASAVPPLPANAPAPRRGLSGCGIAAIIAAVVTVPVIAILILIAVPAYQAYTQRAALSEVLAIAAPARVAMEEIILETGQCPVDTTVTADDLTARPTDPRLDHVLRLLAARPSVTKVTLQGAPEHCHLLVELSGFGDADIDGHAIQWSRDVATGAWVCASAIPDRLLPAACRA